MDAKHSDKCMGSQPGMGLGGSSVAPVLLAGARPFLLILIALLPVSLAAQVTGDLGRPAAPDSLQTRLASQQARLARAKRDFIEAYLQSHRILPANDLNFKLKPLSADYDLGVIHPELNQTRFERELWKRTGRSNPSFLISPALLLSRSRDERKWQAGTGQFNKNAIPSHLQLAVLKSLWTNPEFTGSQIYAALDEKHRITAAGLNRQLHRMMNLGLVERKIISPQNLFAIVTPFKVFHIEQSPLNRKNKIYLYRARVEMGMMVQQLLDRAYAVRHEGLGSPSELPTLAEKLDLLLAQPDAAGL